MNLLKRLFGKSAASAAQPESNPKVSTGSNPDRNASSYQIESKHGKVLYYSVHGSSNGRLRDADLRSLELEEANFVGEDLSGAILSYAVLRHADLSYARLCDAKIDGADFRGATLDGVDWTGAIYSSSTIWPPDFGDPQARGMKKAY